MSTHHIIVSLRLCNHLDIFFKTDYALVKLIGLNKVLVMTYLVIVDKVNIGFVYSMQNDLLNRETLRQGNEANFSSYLHNFVLECH